ncbi:UDP-N-acetylmuramate--L-alanine ligase [Paenibacillus ginsengarvi]|uniref:UDP-N-acetylmuramate--L-alanine ligase n=2 Tax=Paenibacillus ginsengarvi TaxID=400777 RepID=A0A3B0CFJ7_9BACL|nr:UDP-N-acetylmuramate--L-alanine ligase [Paenibacillus ginsengarvi]
MKTTKTTTERVHFIGIGGYGMSAIAKVMLEMGYNVTGSDLAAQELTDKLAAKGARVYIGHEASQVHGADVVVYSTALPADNVEVAEAKRLGIPLLHRSEMLARLMETRKGIAVAGAHGKTTTSSMIALVMETCGLDPTYVIGGEVMNLGSNAKAGKGEYIVAEADESDGSFLRYQPAYAVVTNIEADHLENYDGSFAKLKAAYAQFLSQVAEDGRAVVCIDDPEVRELLEAGEPGRAITYGLEREADYRAIHVTTGDRCVAFEVEHGGTALGTVELSVPGRHNVYNALAAFVVCREAGVPFAEFAAAIKLFRGAKRRFQVLGDTDGILVVDDYAHHPTEIAATIAAAKATGKRVVAVFQPQRYTRTYFLFDQFGEAFGEADEVVIIDIYSPAGEKPIEGISSEKLAELIRRNGNANVRHIATVREATDFLLGFARPGDLVLTMGAGDIWKASHALAKALAEREG